MYSTTMQRFGLIVSGENHNGVFTEVEYGPFRSLQDAEILGLDASYDSATGSVAHDQVKAFFEEADPSAELWVYLVPKSMSLAQICTAGTGAASVFLAGLSVPIATLGLVRVPPVGYSGSSQEGLDADVYACLDAAQALADAQKAGGKPLFLRIGCYGFTGNLGDLRDFAQVAGKGHEQLCLDLGIDLPGKQAQVGRQMGKMSATPLGQSSSYPLLGDSAHYGAWLEGDHRVHSFTETELDDLASKGFQFYRRYVGRQGLFPSQERTLGGQSADFATVYEQRLVQAGILVVRQALDEDLADVLGFNPTTGLMDPRTLAFVKTFLDALLLKTFLLEGMAIRLFVEIDPAHDYNLDPNLPVELVLEPKPLQGKRNFEAQAVRVPRRGAM